MENWEFERLIYNIPEHDDEACEAMLEYERTCRKFENSRTVFQGAGALMKDLSIRYGKSVEEMKQHWQCVQGILGKDPNDR